MTASGRWRHVLLILAFVAPLALLLWQPPLAQDPHYHDLAYGRQFFGVPNFLNVASNVFFLIVGTAGLSFCFHQSAGSAKRAWIVLFAGVALVAVGSTVYHWAPSDGTLVWDRLPMTVGFMGLFVALLTEYVSDTLGGLLLPAALVGLFSVLYWHWLGDLRFYVWIQLLPLLTIPVVMLLYRPAYSHQWLLLIALAWYALAKVSEIYDEEVFLFTGNFISGHSLKHLLAATGCLTILWLLKRRERVERPA